MSTELTTPFGTGVKVKTTTALAAQMRRSSEDGARTGDGLYLNFSGKRGVYELGADKEDIDNDELWLVNIASFADGFVCWKSSKPVATRMANIYGDTPIMQPDPEELGPFDTNKGEGWHQAKSMIIRSLDEDDRQAEFKNNSKSGVSEFAKLQEQVADRMEAGLPAWPVVQLGKEGFEAQGFKNYKPILTVFGWLGDNQVAALAEDSTLDLDTLMDEADAGGPVAEPDPVDEPAPRRKRKKSL